LASVGVKVRGKKALYSACGGRRTLRLAAMVSALAHQMQMSPRALSAPLEGKTTAAALVAAAAAIYSAAHSHT